MRLCFGLYFYVCDMFCYFLVVCMNLYCVLLFGVCCPFVVLYLCVLFLRCAVDLVLFCCVSLYFHACVC